MSVDTRPADTQWMHFAQSPRPGYAIYECTCGTVKEVLTNNVRRGLSKSCGCFKTDMLRERNRRVARITGPLSTTELAWAAGFWDGEGSTTGGLDKRPQLRAPRRRVQMQLAQAGEDGLIVLQRFQRAVGGLGHITGPYNYRLSTKPVYRWGTQGHELVQAILAMLWPFLSEPKRAQASLRLSQLTEGGE